MMNLLKKNHAHQLKNQFPFILLMKIKNCSGNLKMNKMKEKRLRKGKKRKKAKKNR